MKICYLSWKNTCDPDMISAFKAEGHTLTLLSIDAYYREQESEGDFRAKLNAHLIDNDSEAVFSFNFFDVVSELCYQKGIPYFSWVYDCPWERCYSVKTDIEINRIFLFDSDTYLELQGMGVKTARFLPMASNPKRVDMMQDWNIFRGSELEPKGEISFVGSLYTERKHAFFDRMQYLSEETRGYLDGVLNAQKCIYGANFVEECLTPEVLDQMQKSLPIFVPNDSRKGLAWRHSQYVLNRHLTAIERREMLEMIGEYFPVDLYTHNENAVIKGCINHGRVDNFAWAPYVFRQSKINLNITLRSIVNGIPLRCFDIMGAGGFLLTNYQGDLLQFFVPGEQVAVFEDREDLLQKVSYYLAPENEAERRAVAENGKRAIEEKHTYRHRVREILAEL